MVSVDWSAVVGSDQNEGGSPACLLADGQNSWEFRRAAVAETIRSIAPDVIGLQAS